MTILLCKLSRVVVNLPLLFKSSVVFHRSGKLYLCLFLLIWGLHCLYSDLFLNSANIRNLDSAVANNLEYNV